LIPALCFGSLGLDADGLDFAELVARGILKDGSSTSSALRIAALIVVSCSSFGSAASFCQREDCD
jgi:hypothetical protein